MNEKEPLRSSSPRRLISRLLLVGGSVALVGGAAEAVADSEAVTPVVRIDTTVDRGLMPAVRMDLSAIVIADPQLCGPGYKPVGDECIPDMTSPPTQPPHTYLDSTK